MPTYKKPNWQTPYEDLPGWTVMVYMAAGNASELDAFGVRDLREMESGVNGAASVVVQINRAWPDAPQRYEIRPKKSSGTDHVTEGESVQVGSDINGADMGDPRTLSRFLRWSIDKYPAQHYLLVLWGHAYGLGFGRDHNDPLTLDDLKTALKGFESHRKLRSKRDEARLEILGTNACAMSYVEAVYELRKSATYMVASQISVPFAGWPYDAILRKITPKSTTTTKTTNQTSPERLCHIIVDSYTSQLNTPLTGERVEMATLNLTQAEGLDTTLHALAEALKAELLRTDHDQLGRVRDAFLGTVTGDVRPLIDLRDLCNALIDLPSEGVNAAARTLKEALKRIIAPVDDAGENVDEAAGTVTDAAADGKSLTAAADATPGWKSVDAAADAATEEESDTAVDEESDPDIDEEIVEAVSGLGGVGIFAPFVTDEGDLKRLELDDHASELRRRRRSSAPAIPTGKETYFALDLFKGKQTWPWLVYTGLRQEIPEELIAFIESVGVTNRTDKISIAQIIMSIESWFNKFDRVLKDAQQQITADLNDTFVRRLKGQRLDKSQANHVFGPPSLRLVRPVEIKRHAKLFRKLKTVRTQAGAISHGAAIAITSAHEPAGAKASYGAASKATTAGVSPLVVRTIGWFMKVESALEGVERATTRGLNNARFGLGPAGSDGFGEELPKSGEGEELPKSGEGEELPKSGEGRVFDSFTSQLSVDSGSGLEQVAALYRQVAETMQQLERAVSNLESVAAAALTVEGMGEGLDSKSRFAVIAREISRSFGILSEGASNARRTVRRVVSHPVYGLGPGRVPFGLDAREELASKSGLGRRHLQLLS